jgi:hypothetical protein
MTRIRLTKTFIFLAVSVTLSCEDILVDDISANEVILVAPADSVSTYETNQQLLWDPVIGVTEYQLTLFSPDLATAGSVLLDTVLTANSFKLSLNPGAYEWCVKGSNGFYSTAAACRKLIVQESVGAKQIKLLAPADELRTSKLKQTFWWEALTGATQYTLIIVSPDLLTLDQIVLDTTLTKTSVTKELEVGKYEWCVKASDGKTATEMFCRTLEITE